MTFIEDKEEYHQRYHLGFFEDDYDELGMMKTNEVDALLRGRLLHKLMEFYPNTNIEHLLDEIDLTDDRLRKELTQEIGVLLGQIENSQIIKPVLTAEKFRNEVSILRQFGPDFLTGKLDKIYKSSDGQWVVLDYKTNSISSDQLSRTVQKYQIQIETYALLIASVYPEQETYEICLYFLIPDELHSELFDLDHLKLVEQKFEKVIQEIKQYYPYTDIPVGR